MAGILQKKKFNESCKKITKYALKKRWTELNIDSSKQFQRFQKVNGEANPIASLRILDRHGIFQMIPIDFKEAPNTPRKEFK